MNIIEPCCAERQLGQLLREERGRAVMFQTNGDVTLEHWMKAVMLMAGNVRPRVMTLSVPILTGEMMRVVGRYLRLEWVKTLRLMTTDHLPQEHIQQLAGYAGCDAKALQECVELAADADIPDEMLTFSGVDGTVVIQGRIFGKVTPGLSLYAGVYGRTDGPGVRSVMDAWGARFRARRYEVALAAQHTEQSEQVQQTEQPKKKRTTRKKTK